MVILKAVLVILAMTLCVGFPLFVSAETVVVDKSFNGREIKVRAGGMIQVELEQLGAAGFVWELQDLNKEHFEVVSVKMVEPQEKPELVGGPVKKIWLIRTKAKGKMELKLIHFRPWEGEGKASDTFVLKVRIL